MDEPRRPRPRYLEAGDKELVVAYQAGDQSAYEEIYRRHSARVRRICYRMLGNGLDADEATQEVFLRSYQAFGRFNGQYQVGAWLARIANNVCIDQLRRRHRVIEGVERPEDIELEAHHETPDNLVVDQVHLSEALSVMTPLHSKALMLRAIQGLSHVEMAGELDMTPQQVKSLLHRARSSFRRAWQHASGFAVMPIATLRNLAGKSRDPHVHQVANIAPMTATSLERVAAGAVAMVLAVSGLSSSGHSAGQRGLRLEEDFHRPPVASAPRPSATDDARREPRKGPAASKRPVAPLERVAALSNKIQKEITGNFEDDENDEPRENDRGGNGLPPTGTGASDRTDEVKRSVEETGSKVQERLDERFAP